MFLTPTPCLSLSVVCIVFIYVSQHGLRTLSTYCNKLLIKKCLTFYRCGIMTNIFLFQVLRFWEYIYIWKEVKFYSINKNLIHSMQRKARSFNFLWLYISEEYKPYMCEKNGRVNLNNFLLYKPCELPLKEWVVPY